MSRELTGPAVRAWLQRFIDVVHQERAALAELDRRAGDGDFATNLASALRQASRRVSAGPSDSASAVFARVSEGFLDTGGTSGPLFGMWFRELAKAMAENMAENMAEGADAAALAAGVAAGVATVQRLGQAQVGDKTMVDAMLPAAEAMTGRDLDADLAAAARAARTGAVSTEALRARRGRASYLGEVAVGVLDPGAVTVALFFECGCAPAPGPETL
ncbi:MAG: dihydroxyacetone kinase subunit DhaL [Pseudonocardiaceae bacterium]